MQFEDYATEYVAAFAGVGLLALLVFHPTVAPTIIGGLQSLVTRVTDLGSNVGSVVPPVTLPSSPASTSGTTYA